MVCNPALLLVAATGTTWAAGLAADKKAKKKAEAAKNTALQGVAEQKQEQIAHNQLANSVQTTEELKNPTLTEEIKKQKVPLNTGSTGTQFSTPTSVGLNLGGY